MTPAVRFLIRFLPGAALLAAGLVLGSRGAGQLPPLGPLLDPANGVWAAARAAAPPRGRIDLPGMEQPVEVVIDRRGVPHIYAATEADAYRTLGFLTARDRLFQLELQPRAAAGRLSEWIGARGLEPDRQARRLGFPRLIDTTLARIDTASAGYRSIVAYGEGINAWIDRMRPGELPLEYRLLRVRPKRWDVTDTFYLLGRMALTLAFNDPSLTKARAAALVGREAADALFPIDAPLQEPIQPNEVDQTRVAFAPLPPPGAGDSTAARVVAALDRVQARLGRIPREAGDAVLGSNNWAVSPRRAAAGRAILAGDPHLRLTLPSIWYQAHLVVPDRLDVQGVTLPGAPWVIIGFNRDIAWSFTNTGSDVNDYYRESVDDPAHPTRYRVDGAWRPVERRVEAYRGPAGDTLAVDTLRFTHRGPLLQVDSLWLSMAWTIYDGSTSAEQFLAANRARTAGEFLEAMSGYVAPAQNMLVADRRGTIAIRSTGRYPIRPASGRGDLVFDGSVSADDWRGSLPVEFYPFSVNPTRGFLSSANQQPVDPLVNRRYLGADWPAPWRAMRINQLLRADSAVTVDAMRRYQTDRTSARAQAFLPFLLGDEGGRPAADLPPTARAARAFLREWDLSYDRGDRRAVLFETVMEELERRTWDELLPRDGDAGSGARVRPSEMMLLELLHDPGSPWWDDRRTADRRETRDDIVAAALATGLERTRLEHGEPDGDGWRWGTAHRANIYHLLQIPALSALDLPVDAGPGTLNPSSGSGVWGPSWRMVVELGDEVRAWATYPGGQSGNPASPHYQDLLPGWLEGRLDSLVNPPAPGAFPEAVVAARLSIRPRR